MPIRTRQARDLPDLPEELTERATLRIEASIDRARSVSIGMVVPARDTVACALIAGAVAIGAFGPWLTLNAASLPAGWLVCVICAQEMAAVVLGWIASHHRRAR